jgi:uncharacterized UPF0160 family protein
MRKGSFGTHDGSFHADEVCACALLVVFGLVDVDKIVRTRAPKELEACEFVCDVGGVYDPKKKRFDHHQIDYTGALSSAGMVLGYLQEIGRISPGLYEFLRRSLILGVDAHDNGHGITDVGVCTFSGVIANFVPASYESTPQEQDLAFFRAMEFAVGHLSRLVERHAYMEECRSAVEKAMEDGAKVLMFDRAMPWLDLFFELGGESHPAQFVVMPSGGHWKLRVIPPTLQDRMRARQSLPEAWAGLMDGDLRKVSGIQGAIFCHKGRFISVWATKQDALQALREVLK